MNPESQQNSTETSSGEDTSLFSRLTAGRVAALICIFLFALYPGVILCTHSFFFRDYGFFTYPVAYYEHESFWRGEMPLWNPLNSCGVPFLAQWNTSACYPPSLIFMLLPLPQSLNYFLLAHLVLAGVGMFSLARRWTENNLAAAVAGIAFALNGLMLNSLIWTSNLAALSWQPLVMLCVERAWQTGDRKKIILAAFAGAMQMLSGAPEIILFTWTILGALWVSQTVAKKISFAFSLKQIVIVAALVAGLSAIQLLPFFDLLKYSDRSIGTTGTDAFPMPIWGWANLLVPIFHCSQDVFGAWLQPKQAWTSSYYVGIGILALAFVAVWRLRKPVVSILAVASFLGLILALGNDGLVYAWLKHIFPWINFARYPIKFVSIPVFAIPLLAAYGVKILQADTDKIPKQNERALFVIVALLFSAVIGLLAAQRLLDADSPWRNIWRNGAVRIVFLIALAIALVIFNRATQRRLRLLMGIVVIAAVVFDLMTAGLNQNPVVVTKAFGPMEFNMTTEPKLGESRAMLGRQVSTALFYASTTNPVYYLVGVRGALFENCNIPENIPKVDGFSSLHLKNQQRIHDILYGAHPGEDLTNAAPAPLLDFLGISQISETNIFAWQERKSFLPLVTAGQKPIFANETETLKKLETDEFDPRHEVYLPPEARETISAINPSPAKISDATFSAQRIQFTAEAAAPAMVVIAQSFYHNWHAYVDNKPAELWQANGAFQALEISAGNHRVVLRYEDWAFRIGAIISAIMFVACLIFYFSQRRSTIGRFGAA